MATTEIFENLSTATLDTALGGNFNGWTTFGGTELAVMLHSSERVLTGKGTGATAKAVHRPVVAAGEWGRVEGKLKITSGTFTAANDYWALGFYTSATPGNDNASKRVVFLNDAGDLTWYTGAGFGSTLIASASLPLNEWLTVGVAADGTGRYTVYVYRADGTLAASGDFDVPADAGLALYAYVLWGVNQNSQDANGWGTQTLVKDLIARNDFKQYAEASQRRHLRFRAAINGEDAFVTIPSTWNPGLSGPTKAILLGHGAGAAASFDLYDTGLNYVGAGYPYAVCNTHGDTWGNSQSTSDLEALRAWCVSKLGCESQVVLVGYSMGGIAALNYASHYPANVDRIITEAGVAQLFSEYADYGSIATAYGVSAARDIPREWEPLQNAEKLVGIPLLLWAGNADTSIHHDQHARLLAAKVNRLGGLAAYCEEAGETHSIDWDATRNLDFLKAAVSRKDPNLGGNLVEQATTALTQVIPLSAHATYRIRTAAANMLSYLLDGANGALVAVSGTEALVRTGSRRMVALLKVTDSGRSFADVTLERVR